MTEQEKKDLMTIGLNYMIKKLGADTNLISDGFHTFGELYDHRITLFLALGNVLDERREDDEDVITWKSTQHSDGSIWAGWFIAGIGKEPGKQITYHIPMNMWDKCLWDELGKAPEYDGHTSADVLERLLKLF